MARRRRLVLCVRNGTYKASLEPRKIYRVVDDPAAESRSLLRVIDESGERVADTSLTAYCTSEGST